jgi:hypothetical protein
MPSRHHKSQTLQLAKKATITYDVVHTNYTTFYVLIYNTTESRQEIPEKFRNMVLGKDGEYQLD